MTINFKNADELNAYLANGIPTFTGNDIDNMFDEIQSEAVAVDKIRAIPTFSRVCLDY